MNYFSYYTEIEEHFVRRRGKYLLVSPLDWGLIASWRASGVPLHVAVRGIDIAMDGYLARNSRPGGKVSTLAYCHDSVMSEFARYLDSHVGENTSGDQEGKAKPRTRQSPEPDRAAVLAMISARIREIETVRAKQLTVEAREGVERVLSRLDQLRQEAQPDRDVDFEALERDLGITDELLTEQLEPVVPAAVAAEWEKESKKALKVYQKRLPKDVFQKIRKNYLREKVRKHFGVGELSLFHL